MLQNQEESRITSIYYLQDYLREQPDNMKSFNIVAETAQFLNLVYSNINPQNIDLIIQLYETLNEFTVVRIILYNTHYIRLLVVVRIILYNTYYISWRIHCGTYQPV